MMDLIILIGIVVFLILLFLLLGFIQNISQPATPRSELTQNSQTVNGQQQNSNLSTNLPGSEETHTVRHRKNAPTSPSDSNVIPTHECGVHVTSSPAQIFVLGDRREEFVGTDTTHIPETSSTSAACDGLRYRTLLSNRQPQPNPIRRVVYTPSSTLQPQPSTAVNQTNLFDSPLVTGTPSLNSRGNIHTRPTIVREGIVRISSSSSSTTQSSSTIPVPTGNSSVATRSQISASGNSASCLPKDEKKYTIPPIVRDAPQSLLTRVNTIHTTTIHQRDEPLNVHGSSSTSPSSSAARVTCGNVTGATGGVSSESGPSKEEKKYKIPPVATGASPRVVTRLRLVHTAPPPPALPARPTLPARPATPEPPAAEPAARTRLFDPYVENSEPPEKKLDLRGLYLREAMETFYDFFFHMQQVYTSRGRSEDDRYIYIVTGYGKFSENRRPKIKPAVQEFIDENEIRHNWLNEGLVMIDFCAEEDEISDSDDYDDDDEEEEEETNSDDYNGDVM